MDKRTIKYIKHLAVAAEVARLHDVTKQLITGSFWTRVNLNMSHAMYNNIIHQRNAGAISFGDIIPFPENKELETTVEQELENTKQNDSYIHLNYLRKNDEPNLYVVENEGYLWYNFKPRGLLYVLQRANIAAIGNNCVYSMWKCATIMNEAYEKYGLDIEHNIS